MKLSEIRSNYLNFFKDQGHAIVESSSLIPAGDPTLLFANSGMVQFKDTFLGIEKRPYSRATTCQKSLRISGKHNDLENVGRTARHHTFFEMLGNFSFGDYFKREAIGFAWEFITRNLALPKERLWVTVYEDDSEAENLWSTVTDVLPGRILRRGKNDNFWTMGETGPCGPCTEIFYFLGEDEKKQVAGELLADDPRYVEIWNLVFMQFNRTLQGVLEPLPKPSVDTGMGLERVAAVKQGKTANYDCDLLRGIISSIENLSGKNYLGADYTERSTEKDPQYATDVAMRVITDHARAGTFLIGDGILPGSDGRGYVLRRLIRRACRHGRVLGFREPFLYRIAGEVISLMHAVYPEIKKSESRITSVIRAEEEKFLETLDTGLGILNKEAAAVKKRNVTVFPGQTAFLLHDTYGFPLDMTQDILKAQSLSIDEATFNAAMTKQREASRSARSQEVELLLQKSVKPCSVKFLGYDSVAAESKIQGIFTATGEVKVAKQGEEVVIVSKETPFYAESGGQVGDTGTIVTTNGTLRVTDTKKTAGDTICHLGLVEEGTIETAVNCSLQIDVARREKIRRHHSATHILHLALKEVLGDHVKQAGSRVSDYSLRFDFSHFASITTSELETIEALANSYLLENHEIETKVLPIEEARKTGATALFGEKYGDLVRVVFIGPRSIEFCGGTHALRSGDLGIISIASESAVSSGTRRIEAFSGTTAIDILRQERATLKELVSMLNASSETATERLEKILERVSDAETQVARFEQKSQNEQSAELSKKARVLSDGTKVISGMIESASPEQLRTVADDLRSRLGSSCIALASVSEGKAIVLTAVSSDLIKQYHAGNILKEMTTVLGARGGGRADLAQAGGGDPTKISQALKRFEEIVQ